MKRILITILCLSCLCLTAASWKGNVRRQKVASWGSAPAWTDTNRYLYVFTGATNGDGNAIDAYNGYTGTVIGATIVVHTNTAGQVDAFWQFDGSDDAVDVPATINGSADYTFGMWLQHRDGFKTDASAVPMEFNYDGNHVVRLNDYYAASWYLNFRAYEPPCYQDITFGAAIVTNRWDFYVMIHANTNAYCYTNGVLATNVAQKNVTALVRSTIGCSRQNASKYNFFKGWIYRPFAMTNNISSNAIYDLYQNTKPL